MKSVSEMAETNDTHELPRITVVREGVQNSVSQPAASQADVFVQAFGEVDSHL